ncbi:MAG TPA: hypothetical protein VIO61_14980 [Anaerolineaceae bacterium]
MKVFDRLNRILTILICLLLLSSSDVPLTDKIERIRTYTRMVEFDYVNWTFDALGIKLAHAALSTPRYLDNNNQKNTVLRYLDTIRKLDEVSAKINTIFADPSVQNPSQKAAALLAEQKNLNEALKHLAPITEAVLQQQISGVLNTEQLTLAGQPLPPTLYRVTALPLALIISPRNKIQQDANISLISDLTIEEMEKLEKQVESGMKVSALVEYVGGIGVYPTMVMRTTDLNWLLEVIAHEWTHNYLTLRPLGISYERNAALHTMNETTASIAGKEIGLAVLKEYYPERVPPPPSPAPQVNEQPKATPKQDTPPPFSFNKEMNITRVTVDKMLAEGKIDDAEAYMEERRRFLWEHGYQIRRLNQAYFAFHGAYADVPGGAAGEDPVGPAVRKLREKSASLADFINRISWMTSFEELKAAVGN